MTMDFQFLDKEDNNDNIQDVVDFVEDHEELSSPVPSSALPEQEFSDDIRSPSTTKLVFSNKSAIVSDFIDLSVERIKIENNLVDVIYSLRGNVFSGDGEINFRVIAFDDSNIDLIKDIDFDNLERDYEQLFLPKTNILREKFFLKGKEIIVEDFSVSRPDDKTQTKIRIKEGIKNVTLYLVTYDTSEDNSILIFKLGIIKNKSISKTESVYDLRHQNDKTKDLEPVNELDAKELIKEKDLYMFSPLHGSVDPDNNFRFLFGVNVMKYMKSRVAFPELLEEDIFKDSVINAHIIRSRVERYSFEDRSEHKRVEVHSAPDNISLTNSTGFMYFTGVDPGINIQSTYKYTANITTFDPTIKKAKKILQDMRDVHNNLSTFTGVELNNEMSKLFIIVMDIFDSKLPSEFEFLRAVVDESSEVGVLKENVVMLQHDLQALADQYDRRLDSYLSSARKYREETATASMTKLKLNSKEVADHVGILKKEYLVSRRIYDTEFDMSELKEMGSGLKRINSNDIKLMYQQSPKIESILKFRKGQLSMFRTFSQSVVNSKLLPQGGADVKTKTEGSAVSDNPSKDESDFVLEGAFFVEDVFIEYLKGYNSDLLEEFESITSENWRRLNLSSIESLPAGSMYLARVSLAEDYRDKYFYIEK